MSHLFLERPTVRVQHAPTGEPTVIYWRGQRHTVAAVVEHWRENRRWWSSRHRDRDIWQLLTDSGFLMEIIYDRRSARWHLQRIYD